DRDGRVLLQCQGRNLQSECVSKMVLDTYRSSGDPNHLSGGCIGRYFCRCLNSEIASRFANQQHRNPIVLVHPNGGFQCVAWLIHLARVKDGHSIDQNQSILHKVVTVSVSVLDDDLAFSMNPAKAIGMEIDSVRCSQVLLWSEHSDIYVRSKAGWWKQG